MLKVELELPTVSLLAFFGWPLAAAPGGLAIYLAANVYRQQSLKISAGLLGALQVCLALATIFLGAFPPRRWPILATYATTIVFTAAAGLYWASARFNAFTIDSLSRVEIPCLCLFGVSLIFSSCLFTTNLMMLLASLSLPPEKLSPDELEYDFQPEMDFAGSPSFHVSHKKSSSSILSIVRAKRSRPSLKDSPTSSNPLAGLEALPEGFQESEWDVQSAAGNARLKWILSQVEPQSRNVSDSSNLTGAIFPATDYNRRISDMGFQKDEPSPLQKVRKQSSFPQTYERSRLNKSA